MITNLQILQNHITTQLTKTINNISEYLKLTERGYADKFPEMRNEDIIHEFKRRESYYDQQCELLTRCEMIMNSQKELDKLFEEFKYTFEVFALDAKSTWEKVGNIMNKELEKLRVIDKDLKKQNYSEEYEMENFTSRKIATELTRKQQQIQEDNIRKQNEEDKRQHLIQVQDERKTKGEAIQKMITVEEYDIIQQWTERKFGEVLFDTKKDNWKEVTSVFHTKIIGKGDIKSHRIIADHLRSCCFLIADGVLPSNEGRGYVLRRIMRRAMLQIHKLGQKEVSMYKLVDSLVREMGMAYPELKQRKTLIEDTLKNEEIKFRTTLENGLKLLEEEIKKYCE